MNYFWMTVILHVTGVYTDLCFVTEGDSVILEYYIGKEVRYIWMDHDGEEYFIRNCIHHNWCIFDHKGPGDRLKLYQNGSLAITNTTVTDSGDYSISASFKNGGYFGFSTVVVRGFFSFDTDGVSVMEGDSVTLHTGVLLNQEEKIRWYFNQTEIAEILGYHYSRICTDVQCDKDAVRFRDRLKLDHHWTGSLTIRDIRTTDSGLYDLLINSAHRRSSNTKIFIVAVHGVPAAERHKMKRKSVKEGESVTLDTHVTKNPNNSIKWYFNGTPIAVISGDLSYICTDVQCNEGTERFRDRLKLNHQTGSLTIKNTRTTDSGLYKLQIRSSRFTIMRSFSVSASSVVLVSARTRDSLTLRNNVKTNQQEEIRWYFNDIVIAKITGDLSKICTNVRCKEKFKDRLKLEEFGSLVIMNIRTEDAGEYKLMISGSIVEIFYVSVASYSVDSGRVSVMEGDSVTLHTDVKTNQQEDIRWRFNDILIAEITGDLSFICTDVQCNNGTERFRDRLKLDHQTGSLTIRDITTTDSGDYTLQIRSSSIQRNVSVTVTGVSAAERDEMKRKSVKEGESVTLDTYVINKPDIMWHLNDTRIAVITRAQSKIYTDVQCKDAEERFRDRLKLDNQTGSLTITNTRITDSGDYELKIISIRKSSEKTFSVTVYDVPAAERDEMKRKSVKEGESVTLDPGVMKTPNYLMTWYLNDICIAEINEEPRMICTDVHCNNGTERFRDRLKVDHQTGSLTITNTRTTDSGDYKLQINSNRFTIKRSFSVTVTVSGLSAGQIAGICAAAVLLLIAVCVFYFYKRRVKRKDTRTQHNDQANDVNGGQSGIPLMDVAHERSSNHTNALVMNTSNDSSSNHVEMEPAAASEI